MGLGTRLQYCEIAQVAWLFTYTHSIAEIWYLGVLCYVLGVYFCYIATEKYEVCFDVLE